MYPSSQVCRNTYCSDDSACEGKVEAAAFYSPQNTHFFGEKYDISKYLISSTVF